MAKLFHAKLHVCLYLFSHFSSFEITKTTLRRIGATDEQFWPAYSEDVDYYYRSVVEGCHIFRASGTRLGSLKRNGPLKIANAFFM